MTELLGLVLPAWAKYLAAAIAVVAVFGFGYVKGNEHGVQRLLDYQSKQIAEGERITGVQVKVTEKIVTEYVDRVKVIKEKGDETTKIIPQYITIADDAACHVNVGARILHDAAARGEVPPPPGPDNGEPSGLTLSTTLGTVTQNYTTYHEVAARLTACQMWIREQYQATNGEPLK